MSSSQSFIKWFQEYYSHEFEELSNDFKNHWIEKILLNNGEYITRKMVTEFDGCSMCGQCCVNQRCPHVDQNGLCSIHDNPIDDLCRYYPWSGDMGIAPLLLNCDYQVNFFIYYFDNFFKKESSKGDAYG